MSEVTYTPAIVTFIDILGFESLVNKKSAQEIADILNLFKKVNEGDDTDTDAQVFQFSDCVFRVRPTNMPINQSYPLGLVYWEILDLLHIQLELIDQGVFIRAGVSYGDVVVNGGNVFGPALIDAYKLESVLAVYPRVIINSKLFNEIKTNKLLKSHENTPDQEIAYLRQIVRTFEDGVCAIDYLIAAKEEVADYLLFLAKHKEHLVKNLNEFDDLNPVSKKYIWLSSYHNKVVSSLSDYIEQDELDLLFIDYIEDINIDIV